MSKHKSWSALPKGYANVPTITWAISKIPKDAHVTIYAKRVERINLAKPGGWAIDGILLLTEKHKIPYVVQRRSATFDAHGSVEVLLTKPLLIGIKCIIDGKLDERIAVLILPSDSSGNRMLNNEAMYTTVSGMELSVGNVQGRPTFIKARGSSLKREAQSMLEKMPDYVQTLTNPFHAHRPNEHSWVALQAALSDWRLIDLRGMLKDNKEYGMNNATMMKVAKSIALANTVESIQGIDGMPEFRLMNKVDYINTQGDKLDMPAQKEQTKTQDDFNDALDGNAQKDDKTVAAFVTAKLDGVEAPAGHKWFVTENIKLPYMLMRDKDGVFVSLAELANDHDLNDGIANILKAEANKMRALAKAYEMISMTVSDNGRS